MMSHLPDDSSSTGSGSSSNVRRCGQIGDGDDDALSMVDVLNEQARLQADADAVLGASDANNCTYPQGYLKRQALYACSTCTPNGDAGICLACSYACHEGHDLYELYTKRYFTCDCGNEKFGGKECKLFKDKTLNARNHYNHNFKGLYCSCARPYPDPEDSVEDEMIQCILCEDWFHARHLKTSVPESDDFQEMTCPMCMSRWSFLWAYNVPGQVTVVKRESVKNANNEDLDVCGTTVVASSQDTEPTSEATSPNMDSMGPNSNMDKPNLEAVGPSSDVNKPNSETAGPRPEVVNDGAKEKSGKHKEDSDEEEPLAKKMKLETSAAEEGHENELENVCMLKSLEIHVKDYPDQAAFWPEGWRSKLCRCQRCLAMYKEKEIEFLVDELDTVHAYEERGRNASSPSLSDEECEASALAGMNRVQQIEVVRGFIDLKQELKQFLQGFAQEGKVVTENDIQEFFQQMDQRKKKNMIIPPSTCR